MLKELLEKHFDGISEKAIEEIETSTQAIISESVKTKLDEVVNTKKTELEELNHEDMKTFKSGLIDKLNEYVAYIVEEFMKENKVAMESEIKVTMAESFMKNLVSTFNENYVQIDETKVDVVKDLEEKNSELTTKVNGITNDNISLKKSIFEHQKAVKFQSITESLSTNDREKLLVMVEDIDAGDIDTFVKKVKIIQSNLIESKEDKTDDSLLEDIDSKENTEFTHLSKYLPQ